MRPRDPAKAKVGGTAASYPQASMSTPRCPRRPSSRTASVIASASEHRSRRRAKAFPPPSAHSPPAPRLPPPSPRPPQRAAPPITRSTFSHSPSRPPQPPPEPPELEPLPPRCSRARRSPSFGSVSARRPTHRSSPRARRLRRGRSPSRSRTRPHHLRPRRLPRHPRRLPRRPRRLPHRSRRRPRRSALRGCSGRVRAWRC